MRAIVSGAGIAGLASALALLRQGWEVLVVERAPGLRAGGYMIDFFGPGYDAAERLGVLDALKVAASDVAEVDFVDGEGRPAAQRMACPQHRRQLLPDWQAPSEHRPDAGGRGRAGRR